MISLILGDNEFELETLLALTAYDGWGMAPVQRFARRGAQQHGDCDAGYLLEPRFGNLVFRMEETTLTGMYAVRRKLIRLFAPGNRASLRFAMPYGLRQFDVVYGGDLSMPWEAGDWAAQALELTLKASDPTCYDPEVCAVNFGLAIEGGWAIPWVIPWPIGDGSIDEVKGVDYEGDFDAFPVVYLVGPLTNPVMTNMLTGDKLDFTGLSIGTGGVYTVDCRWGYKTVVDETGTNQIDKLSSDSDLGTFCLKASEVGNEVQSNEFRLTATGMGATSNAILKYYTRYLGI